MEGGAVVPRPVPATSEPAAAVDRDGGEPPGDDDAGVYERLLTRPHATFGLAGARGIERARLDAVLDQVADAFEGCALGAQRDGWLDKGAVRLVVELDAHGQVSALDAKLDDPAAGGKVTLLCLVAPVKAQAFGEGQGRRGFALEVLFGPARQ